jgi:lipopolysaccharide transport system permease protein
VQFAVLLIGYAFYFAKMKGWLWFAAPDPLIHLDPNWRLALLPVLLLMLTMLGLGAGFIIAALTTRYKDMQLAVGFGVQLWMYASSVVFPLSKISAPTNPDQMNYVALLKLNPAVPIIEGFRYALLGRGTVEQMDLIVSGATCAAVFVVGLIMFSRTEQTVMDTV